MTLSWCWEMPSSPEGSLFDRLRDFPDAYRAMQEAVRQWRAIHLPRRQ